jgi:hypothetical protein
MIQFYIIKGIYWNVKRIGKKGWAILHLLISTIYFIVIVKTISEVNYRKITFRVPEYLL